MPFYRVNPAIWDEMMREAAPGETPLDMGWERPSGEFEYSSQEGRFQPETLQPVARVMLETLQAMGATALRVRYDGGFDEGFADPDAVLFGERSRPAADVLRELATPELIERIRGATGWSRRWGNQTAMYARANPAEAVRYALDELALELATHILGSGFGTGEGELYGAFTADFSTGELVDDPNAPRPDRRD